MDHYHVIYNVPKSLVNKLVWICSLIIGLLHDNIFHSFNSVGKSETFLALKIIFLSELWLVELIDEVSIEMEETMLGGVLLPAPA